MTIEEVMAHVNALFRDNSIPMSDRNGVLYDLIEVGMKVLVAQARDEEAEACLEFCEDFDKSALAIACDIRARIAARAEGGKNE